MKYVIIYNSCFSLQYKYIDDGMTDQVMPMSHNYWYDKARVGPVTSIDDGRIVIIYNMYYVYQ